MDAANRGVPKEHMFTFIHPKPFNQRAVAMQVVARKTEALPDLHVLVVEMAPRVTNAIQPGAHGVPDVSHPAIA